MPRYNSSLASTSIAGSTTIGSPYSGAFIALTGTAPYTVTLPSPVLFPGSNQTFYNNTSGTVTLSTPVGVFTGTGGNGTSNVNCFSGNVVSVTSDGSNYIVISEDGSALVATTGSFSSNLTVNGGTTSLTPSSFTLNSTGVGNIDNITIGASARAAGSFTTLSANAQTSLTGNIASSNTGTGTLVVTGGIGASGTINATSVVASSLTGTVQTAAQPNITSLGTVTALSTGTIRATGLIYTGNGIATGENFEKYLGAVSFDNAVANRATNIQFGNLPHGGLFEITISSTYSNQNAAGGIKKIFSVLCNPDNAIYGYESRVTEAVGPITSNFAIGEFQWSGTQYIIPISHIVAAGNPVYVHIKVYGIGSSSNVWNNVSLSAVYTLSALARNYEYFNSSVAIGTSTPTATLDVRGGVAVSGWSNNNGGSAGGVELGWDGTQALMQSYNRAGNAYTPVTLNGSVARMLVSGTEVLRAHSNRNVGINTNSPNHTLHVYNNNNSGNSAGGTVFLDRLNNSSYENSLNFGTAGTKQWFFGQDNDGTEDLLFYNWVSSQSIWKASSDGIIKGMHTDGSKAYTFVRLTTPKTWTATFGGQVAGSFTTTSTLGLPAGIKALSAVGYYHVTGYGQGTSGQGDHALSQFGPRAQGGGTPWSFNTSTDTEWGSYTLEHDGDASGSPHNYGAWNGVGLINVGSSDTVHYILGRGYSGGTHYNSLWIWGYWI